MRILIKHKNGNDIHLYNSHEINEFEGKSWEDGLNLNDWLDHSAEVSISYDGDTQENKFRVGALFTLPPGLDFIRDVNRISVDDDYWVMTESGLLIQLQILSGSTEIGKILEIKRSAWMMRSSNMDHYYRTWKRLGGRDTISPAEIHNVSWDKTLLDESSFPVVSFQMTTRGTKMSSLRNLKLDNTLYDFIQWRVGSGSGWENFDSGIIRLDTDDAWWRDGAVSNIDIRFIPTEAQIHKLRDVHIHSRPDYHKSPTFNFNISLDFDGYFDSEDGVGRIMYKPPFGYTGIGTRAELGNLKIDTVKFKIGSDTTPTGANSVFQDTSFDGGWVTASAASFHSGLETISAQGNESLPANGWIAGDNGSLFNLKAGAVEEVVVSDKKFLGNNRLTSITSGVNLHITGDFRICDINDDKLCEIPQNAAIPYSYNNFATVSIKTSSPVTRVSVQTKKNDNNYIPAGTVDCLRAKSHVEWNTLMNSSMDVGDFFIHENDPEKLEEAKKKPSHDITVTFRKIPGYLFDVKYPTESTRVQNVEVVSKYKIFDPLAGWEEREVKKSFGLQIYRNSPRWGLDEIPYEGRHAESCGIGATTNDDRGFAKLVASRTINSWTEGVLGANYAEEDWETGAFRQEYSGKYGTFKMANTPGGDGVTVGDNFIDGKPHKMLIMWSDSSTVRDADGGWDLRIDKLDRYSSYVSAVYFHISPDLNGNRVQQGTLSHRLGISDNTDCTRSLNNQPQSTPSFNSVNCVDIPSDVWCISIGYLRSTNSSTDQQTWGSGIWRTDTWEQIHQGTDYMWGPCDETDGLGYNAHSVIFENTESFGMVRLAHPMFYKMQGSLGQNAINQFRDGFEIARIDQKHPTMRGAWSFDGLLAGHDVPMRYTDIVNGARSITDHEYNAGVLYESSYYGSPGNQCTLEQSNPPTFNIPINTLKGGIDASEQYPRRATGGAKGPAIDCFSGKCTVNNQGTIIGEITNK